MKTRILTSLLLTLAFSQGIGAQTRTLMEDGTVIINTTEIGQDIMGHHAATPVEITIKDDIIQDVTALSSRETPRFFSRAINVLKRFIGLSTDEALTADIDGVSGATMTSRSLIWNVQEGLRYHKDNPEEESQEKGLLVEIRPQDLIRK